MKLPRRQFLHLAAGAAALPAVWRFAWAQAYPTRSVRIIVGQAAGSGTDIAARLLGQWLSERLGKSFVVENRPGAAGNIATEAVARAAADGYTLLLIDTQPAINATLFDKLNFDFIRDIAPVAGIIRMPAVMVANPSLPAKTVPEFIAYAKANPGKLNFASPGNGSGPHLAGELLSKETGTNLLHVPYKGNSQAMAGLLGGETSFQFAGVTDVAGQIQAGAVRGLAVTALKAHPVEKYRQVLLDALRYPWPPAADHAAETLVAVGDTAAVPQLRVLLDAPDPSVPLAPPVAVPPPVAVRPAAIRL